MDSKTTSSGIGVLGLLQVAFIVLKVIKVIDWPWWKVLIPLWIELGIAVIALFVFLIFIRKSR